MRCRTLGLKEWLITRTIVELDAFSRWITTITKSRFFILSLVIARLSLAVLVVEEFIIASKMGTTANALAKMSSNINHTRSLNTRNLSHVMLGCFEVSYLTPSLWLSFVSVLCLIRLYECTFSFFTTKKDIVQIQRTHIEKIWI